jgi:hypothetical protein
MSLELSMGSNEKAIGGCGRLDYWSHGTVAPSQATTQRVFPLGVNFTQGSSSIRQGKNIIIGPSSWAGQNNVAMRTLDKVVAFIWC